MFQVSERQFDAPYTEMTYEVPDSAPCKGLK